MSARKLFQISVLIVLATSICTTVEGAIIGKLWENEYEASIDAIFDNIPTRAADMVFTVPNGTLNFNTYTSYTIGGFLTSGGATILSGTSCVNDTIDNCVILFTGIVSVTNGSTVSVSHDDGFTLQIGCGFVVSAPGETSEVTTTATYSGPSGNSPFQLFYGECCGGAAILVADVPLTDTGTIPLTKFDDVNDGDCVGPGREINYTIDYNCPAGPNFPDINDMNIIDNLPAEVTFVSDSNSGRYDSNSNTVIWNIGTLSSGGIGSVTLTVQVNNNVIRGSTITNYCELTGGCVDMRTSDTTLVCSTGYPIYVDISATGGNNGSSWADAFTNLQDALKAAKDDNCNEILVAQGIYRPDINSAYPNGTGDRTATFQLLNGVAIYGGFPTGGGAWQVRNPAAYQTILSGDLLSNDRQVAEPCDLLTDPCRADNSYHVVTGIGVTQTAILDGFTITGGDANGDGSSEMNNVGGGMYNSDILQGDSYYGGNPTVSNCVFKWNAAQSGGGIYSNSGDSNEIIMNCTFIENSAYSYYGGYGGGIYINADGVTTVTNCVFNQNSASGGDDYWEGVDYYYYYGGYGGGISIDNGGVSYVTNCTFVANRADWGSGTAIYGIMPGENGDLVIVTNCILWDNNNSEQISGDIDANVTYSDIGSGWPGVGNIQDYPMFEADGYHLKMCSPCIDAGTNTPPGGLPATDIDGQDRIMNGECAGGAAIVDMGADEYLPDCNAMLYAHCRNPACDAIAALYVGESPDVNLTWCPGIYAANVNGHDVYFGTDYSGVYNATTTTPVIYKGRQSATSYLAVGLEAGNTYYWRIDEVNDANIWRGRVYSFRTGLFIDDFERYSNTNDMNANWKTGYTVYRKGGGCNLSLQHAKGKLSFVWDTAGKHMNFCYQDEPSTFAFSEANRPYIGGTVFTNGSGPNKLVISYKGAIDNSTDPCYDRMYVALEDTAGYMGVKYNPDPNAALVTAWTSWCIPLNDSNLASVNMAAVVGFHLGFGNRLGCMDNEDGGDGNVMFDNIRLEQRYADFTCDCFVNFNDFAVMGAEWHTEGVKANIYPLGNPDNIVDIMDFAILADEWLKSW